MPSVKSTERLDSSKVAEFARRTRRFTTDRVATQFKVTRQKAAAAIAILRIKETVEPDVPAKDPAGVSRWIWVG
jgi:hypothetical protein